MAKIDIIF